MIYLIYEIATSIICHGAELYILKIDYCYIIDENALQADATSQ